MLKKFLTAMLVAAVSTNLMAKADHVKTLKMNVHEIDPWEIAVPPPGGQWWSVGLLIYEPQTLIINVNKYRSSNPKLMSDPVLFDCAGVPTLITAGTSTVCTVTSDLTHISGIDWGVPERYRNNGSDGYIIRIE